jgi:hypothetical protein
MTDQLSSISPPGYEQHVFETPNLPMEPFMLQDIGEPGGPEGPYRADEFTTEPLTNIMFSQEAGDHPEYLRVLKQDGALLTTVDSDGATHTQQIITIPDNTMALDGADAGSLTDAQRDAIADRTGAVS